jgi:hypothetical protein
MYPPLFATLAASTAVKALIGSNPVRAWPAGKSPQPGTTFFAVPYVTWQTIDGLPENYLGTAPDSDSFTAQVDVWADTDDSARDVAEACRDALQTVAYITAWRGESREPATNRYRYSFDVSFIASR